MKHSSSARTSGNSPGPMNSPPGGLVSLAVAAPVAGYFTYLVPERLRGRLQCGQLVEVPFGRGRRRALVVQFVERAPAGLQLKPVARLLEQRPVLSRPLLETLRWAAGYYLVPPGEMFFAALPPLVRSREAPAGGPRQQVATLLPEAAARASQLLRAPLQARLVSLLAGRGGSLPVSELARLAGSGVRAALRSLEKKEMVRLDSRRRERQPRPASMPPALPVERLTADQQRALGDLRAALSERKQETVLLQGVTGSGKTEVYLGAMELVLARGDGAILMVPEISLTPQLESRVRARFGALVAVLHSALSPGERADEWRRLFSGQARVALGARSAVFAPLERVGLIVVDEEHDSSYKQSERLPYNGRDLAMVRARQEGALVVLGTATPSLEAYHRARSGKSGWLVLGGRVGQKALPRVEIIDLKKDLADPLERQHTLSAPLAQALAETLDRGQQAILFLNRRGYASFSLCKDCGRAVHCSDCSVALVHHRRDNRLRCHYCGREIEPPAACPACGSARMRLFGLGTEKCEEEVRRRFPGARVLRMDADSVARRGAHAELLGCFARGEADVLVGTQMVTKGHDIPGVTLVGVVLADLGLNLPDFRAAERTFQQLVQVAGRAGRGDNPGRVLVQTFLPDHPAISLAANNRLEEFQQWELARRRRLGYPPLGRLLLVRVSHPDARAGRALAGKLAGQLRRLGRGRLEVLGPSPSPLARIRNRYRFQVLVKSPTVSPLQEVSARVRERLPGDGAAKILFDVDPFDML